MFDETYDWWCLGILTYELFEGKTPFENDNVFKQQNNIRNTEPEFSELNNHSQECKSFILELLTKSKEKRLGHNGASDIKSHPWFANLNWYDLENKNLEPPFDPKVSTLPETFYFSC